MIDWTAIKGYDIPNENGYIVPPVPRKPPDLRAFAVAAIAAGALRLRAIGR